MNELEYIAWYPDKAITGALDLAPQHRGLYFAALTWQAAKGAIPSPDAIASYCGDTVENAQAVLDAKFAFDRDAGGWKNARMSHEREKAVSRLANRRAGAAKARARKETVSSHTLLPKERQEESRVDSETKLDTKLDIKKPSVWELTQKIEKGESHLKDLRKEVEWKRGDVPATKEEIRDLKAKLQGWRRSLTNHS